MKKIILAIQLLAITSNLFSQSKVATTAQIQRFLVSTTYVVLEENPFSVFNEVIKSAMEQYWKITPFKIINTTEFEKTRIDPSKSFLFISYAEIVKTKTSLFSTQTSLFDNEDQFRYNLLNLILGERSGNLNKMPDLASLPLSYAAPVSSNEDDQEEDEIDYTYKIGGILRLMQFYINWTVENPTKTFDNLMSSYTSEMKTLELWVTKEDLGVDASTVEKIAKVYPHNVKIVTVAEIETAIKEGKSHVVFIHKIGPEKFKLKDPICFITLINCGSGKPYFFTYHKAKDNATDGMVLSEFKALSK